MQYIEAEVLPEFPPEAVAEDAEASAPLAEATSGSKQTYTSSELAGFFGVSDRSIRTWVKRIKETWYSLESELMINGRYTPRCYQVLADYKRHCVDGDERYEDYRSRAWREQVGTKPANSSTAIQLSAHRSEVLASQHLNEATRVLDGVKQDLKSAYENQPTLAKVLARKFAASFKQEFALEYSREIGKAIQEVTEISLIEE